MKRRLASIFLGSSFKRNFLGIAGANLFAQALLVAAIPLLAREYTPEAFGLAGVFLAALQVSGAFSTLKYERLVPNQRSRAGAEALFILGVLWLCAFCSVLLGALLAKPELAVFWNTDGDSGSFILWLPVAVFALGLNQLSASLHVRNNILARLSAARIAQSVGYICVALLIAPTSFSQGGLIVATTFSWLASSIFVFPVQLFRSVLSTGLRWSRLRVILCNSAVEAASVALVALVNVFSLVAPVFLLSEIYDSREIGYYSLMMRMIGTPLTIVTAALSVAFWSHSAQLVRDRKYAALRTTYLRTTLVLLAPALAVATVCYFGPNFVVLAFGPEWAGAGPVLFALLPMLVGIALFSPTNHLVVLRFPLLQLVSDGVRLVLMFSSLVYISSTSVSFSHAVFLFAMSSFAGHFLLFALHLAVHHRIKTTSQDF